MNNRLTKSQRLLHARDFSQVFSAPALRLSTPRLLILAQTNELGVARLGLVISRKHVGCAVARNRIKRLCREAFRLRAAEFAAVDLVILARSGLGKLDNAAVTAALNSLFDKLSQKGAAQART